MPRVSNFADDKRQYHQIMKYIALALISVTFSTLSFASTSSETNDSQSLLGDTTRIFDLDEVIVVSQPKETVRLRRQPTASNVFSSEEMTKLSIESMSDVSRYVPSLNIPQYGSRLTSSVYVRGIGSRIGDPAMGVYYDNIPLVSKSAYNTHFYQLDRIDILRGPQGTLYGINTEGGLMRVYSKNPMSYQGTDVLLGTSIGVSGSSVVKTWSPTTRLELAKYHRPSEEFAFSVAAFYNGNKGYFNNSHLGEVADKSDEAGGRTHLVWRPGEKLSVELTSDFQYVNENAFPYGEYNETDNSWSTPATTIMNGYKRQMLNTGLHIAYRLPDWLISSTTSWQWLKDKMVMDQDYLPADYMQLEQAQKMNALTEEITIKTRSAAKWQHTSGLFFSYEWLKTNAPVYFGDDMNAMIKEQMGMPAMVAQGITLTDNLVAGVFHTPRLNLGAYHESNVSLTDRLMLTLGLRYDYQHASIDYNTQANFTLGYKGTMMGKPVEISRLYTSLLNNSASDSYHELLPKIALTYRIDNRGSNIYATVAKGFRAGGYNLQMFSDIFRSEQSGLGNSLMDLMKGDMTITHTDENYDNINKTITYSPEESWNYEFGAHLNFPKGIKADAAAYYMKVQNQQLSIMADKYGYGRMMINANGSETYGVEMALRSKTCANHLDWAATYSWTHSKLDNSNTESNNTASNTGSGQTTAGKTRMPFIPAHSFSVATGYRFDMRSGYLLQSLTIGADVSGCGDIYWDIDNKQKQKFYALLGARVELDFGDVKIDLRGNNLTDTRYNTFLVSSSVDGTPRTFSQIGTPARISLNIKMNL